MKTLADLQKASGQSNTETRVRLASHGVVLSQSGFSKMLTRGIQKVDVIEGLAKAWGVSIQEVMTAARATRANPSVHRFGRGRPHKSRTESPIVA